MTLDDYISFDEVRAALGVSDDEIEDTTLSLDLYAFHLVSELEGVSDTLIADYAAQKETPPGGWTAIQTRFHQTLRVFCVYAVAKQALVSLPMFAPKEQTDGKAGVVRFALDPYKSTIAGVNQAYDSARSRLAAAYGAVVSIAPLVLSRPYMAVANPDYDPVTGA